jgi:hypothetical protein
VICDEVPVEGEALEPPESSDGQGLKHLRTGTANNTPELCQQLNALTQAIGQQNALSARTVFGQPAPKYQGGWRRPKDRVMVMSSQNLKSVRDTDPAVSWAL